MWTFKKYQKHFMPAGGKLLFLKNDEQENYLLYYSSCLNSRKMDSSS